jgi:hypothetical protein
MVALLLCGIDMQFRPWNDGVHPLLAGDVVAVFTGEDRRRYIDLVPDCRLSRRFDPHFRLR